MGILEAALACLPGFDRFIYAQHSRAGTGQYRSPIAANSLFWPRRVRFTPQLSCPFLLVLALAKMAISLTVTGGWRGGFIIPLFHGACIGKAIAALIPGLNPALAMICTMAALNAAVTRTPVSTTCY